MIGNFDRKIKVEKINENYEWYQYNSKIRIIHSIVDDMFQMESIIKACNSKRKCKDWFRNETTREILGEMARGRNLPLEKIYIKREKEAIELRGYYVHRLLVNEIARWASPKYALYIYELLDDIFEENKRKLEEEIENLKEKVVPAKEKDYVLIITKEELDNGFRYKFCTRDKKNIRKYKTLINNSYFFKDELPCGMNYREILRKNFKVEHNYILDNFEIIDMLDELFN